jgi:hypothetical protein
MGETNRRYLVSGTETDYFSQNKNGTFYYRKSGCMSIILPSPSASSQQPATSR